MIPLLDRSTGSDRVADSGYRSDIDGLRAIAVLAVVLFHGNIGPASGGFTGVDIFFTISGFLIGGHIYLAERTGRFTLREFYQRRAKRILPALFTVLLATLLLGTLVLSPYELRSAATDGIATLLSVSNIFFWHSQGYFAVKANLRPLLMTWSLGVEEQFYLFVPLIIIFSMRYRLPLRELLAVLISFSFGIACFQVATHPNAAFYLLPGRCWELLAGVLLAIFSGERVDSSSITKSKLCEAAGVTGLLLVVLPIFFIRETMPFPGLAAVPSVLGTSILLASSNSWVNQNFLSMTALRYVGRISYSLYLWHWPLLSLAAISLGGRPSTREAMVLLTLAFLLASASYYLVEQPFRRSKTKPWQLLRRYTVGTLILLTICFVIRSTFGLSVRAPELAREEKENLSDKDRCAVTDGADAPPTSDICSPQSRRPAVALWGDSHASAISAVMRGKANAAGYDFWELSKTACPPIYGGGLYFQLTPAHAKECIKFNDQVIRELAAARTVHIVILEANWKSLLLEPYLYGTGWIVSRDADPLSIPSREKAAEIFTGLLAHTVQVLQAAGKQVIVMEDVPSFFVAPTWRYNTARLPFRAWLFRHVRPAYSVDSGFDTREYPDTDDQMRKLIHLATAQTTAQLVDLEAPLCPNRDTCLYRDEQLMFFKDTQHVTTAGAHKALSQWVLPATRIGSR